VTINDYIHGEKQKLCVGISKHVEENYETKKQQIAFADTKGSVVQLVEHAPPKLVG